VRHEVVGEDRELAEVTKRAETAAAERAGEIGRRDLRALVERHVEAGIARDVAVRAASRASDARASALPRADATARSNDPPWCASSQPPRSRSASANSSISSRTARFAALFEDLRAAVRVELRERAGAPRSGARELLAQARRHRE
jgi:hypothetical protein